MAARIAQSRPLAALVLLASLLSLGACGIAPDPHPTDPLLTGSRTPIPPAQFGSAASTAHRFASAYARSIYLRHPPPLPGATPRLDARLESAANRVPPGRRHLHPRGGALRLEPKSATHLDAVLTVLDGRSPPFTVGIELTRRGRRWLVTSISPPG
jgi:hypothetical protein